MMNTALILNDLDMNKELDSSWKYNFWTGRYHKTWKQYRYAKRTQYGRELAASGTVYA